MDLHRMALERETVLPFLTLRGLQFRCRSPTVKRHCSTLFVETSNTVRPWSSVVFTQKIGISRLETINDGKTKFFSEPLRQYTSHAAMQLQNA